MLKLNQVYCGDALEVMKDIDDNFIAAIVTDPPAGISFMGKNWDKDKGGRDQWIEWLTTIMKECLRVIKPGGMILVWSIPRTSHWTATAIENAGFEIRDKIYHLFGSGFPKSHDISKAIDKAAGVERKKGCVRTDGRGKWELKVNREKGDTGVGHADGSKQTYQETIATTPEAKLFDGYGTALKPAAEEWILAMAPLDGTFANNAIKYGVAGLNIDGSRVEATDNKEYEANTNRSHVKGHWGNSKGNAEVKAHSQGRWPANIIFEHHPECIKIGNKEIGKGEFIEGSKSGGIWSKSTGKPAGPVYGNETIEEYQCHPDCPIFLLNQQVGIKKSGLLKAGHPYGLGDGQNVYGKLTGKTQSDTHADQGYVSRYFKNLPPDTNRFFYSPKASRSERNKGTEGVITWESVDLSQDLMELKELLKDISEDGLRKINDNEWSMMSFGKNIMGISQKDMMSIISMALKMITVLKILSCSQNLSIKDYTQGVIKMVRENGLNLAQSVESINWLKQNTTNETMEYALGVVIAVLKMLIKIIEKGRKGNIHSTIKPLALMKYLCTLVKSPTKGIILDPFGGSGTTAVACEQLGIPYIIIEKEPDYCEIIKCRIKAANDSEPIKKTKKQSKPKTNQQLGLFPQDKINEWCEIK